MRRLIAAALVATTGCSLAFLDGPKADRQDGEMPICDQSFALVAMDIQTALAGVAGVILQVALYDDIELAPTIASGIIGLAYGISAGVGAGDRSDCEKATRAYGEWVDQRLRSRSKDDFEGVENDVLQLDERLRKLERRPVPVDAGMPAVDATPTNEGAE